tara:strand:- start:111 stop:365 length:255 start_codon:yes stop_codon:yes gene_type:complete
MAFKMKGYVAKGNTPLEKNWWSSVKEKAGKAKDWFKTEVGETMRTGKDPAERRSEGRQHAHMMNPRNRSEEAQKYRAEQAAKNK